MAVPQHGDPAGKSSRLVATHDHRGTEQEFEGTVSGEIGGKPYLGEFEVEAHTEPKPGKKEPRPAAEGRRLGKACPRPGRESPVPGLSPAGAADTIFATGSPSGSVEPLRTLCPKVLGTLAFVRPGRNTERCSSG